MSTTTSFDTEKRVGQLRALELKIKEIEKKHEEELEPFKKMAVNLRAMLLDFLNVTNQQNSKTNHGTIYKSERTSCSIEDQSAFKQHVIGSEAWELLDWKANLTATKDYIKEHKENPPGVKVTSMIVLGVLAPTKKKQTANLNKTQVEIVEEAAE